MPRNRNPREAVQRCAQPGRCSHKPTPPGQRRHRGLPAHHAKPMGVAPELVQVLREPPSRRPFPEGLHGRGHSGRTMDASAEPPSREQLQSNRFFAGRRRKDAPRVEWNPRGHPEVPGNADVHGEPMLSDFPVVATRRAHNTPNPRELVLWLPQQRDYNQRKCVSDSIIYIWS